MAILLLFSSGCAGMSACGPDDTWFGKDKARHFAGAAMIAAGGTVLAANSTGDDEAALIGFSAAMTAGAGKELYDGGVKKTCFSWKDLFWDFLGASVGAGIAASAMD